MALVPTAVTQRSSDCATLFWEDDTCNYEASTCPGGYGAPNIAKAAVTRTEIIISNSDGAEWIYSDYLPTEGEVELIATNFSPVESDEEEEDTGNNGCGCSSCEECEEPSRGVFGDGCKYITYKVYSEGDELEGTYTVSQFWYCNVRNGIFDLISGSCNDCCDSEKQLAIRDARDNYNNMLTAYNKNSCTCAENQLARLETRLTNIENDCIGC